MSEQYDIVPANEFTKLATPPGEYFAKIVTGKTNLNAIILIQGPTGSGKSYYAMSLALDISQEIAKIKGTNRNIYFPEDLSNMSIITLDSVKDLMLGNTPENSILILDDISTSYSSRSWQSKSNQVLNNILTVFRPKRNILILTMPSQGMIDLNARRLAHYLIEVERNPRAFAMDLGVGKMFKLKPQRSGKIFAQYVREGRTQIVRTVVRKPPQHICDLYDERRNIEFDKIMKKSLDEWDAFEAKENERVYGKKDKKPTAIDRRDEIIALSKGGMKQKDIATEMGVSQPMISHILKGE